MRRREFMSATAAVAASPTLAWAVNGPAESVRVLPVTEFQTGTTGSFTVVYTVGPKGIPASGSVGIAFKHAINIKFSTDPNAVGYVKAVCASGADITVQTGHRRYIYPGKGQSEHLPAESKPLNAIVRSAVFADVGSSGLKPGEKVSFIFGANKKGIVLPLNVCDNPMRAVVDPEGDNTYSIVPVIPEFHLVARKADHFFVTIPSTRCGGETADVCIRAEDPANNLATSFNGKVALDGMPGCGKVNVKMKDGVGRVDLPVK
jgi:hypothetical protein